MPKSPFDVTHQNKDIDGRIIAALERIAEAFRVLLWNEGKELSMSPIQLQVLIFLMHHAVKGKVSLLAQEFNMTKATLSDTVKSLEEKKLIRKQNDPNDSRSYSIKLTSKGEEMAKQSAMFAQELLTPISDLHEHAKTDLLLSLIQIIHHLNQKGVITVQRMCSTCHYFQPGETGNHYCNLLKAKLANEDLRIDCPEHMPK